MDMNKDEANFLGRIVILMKEELQKRYGETRLNEFFAIQPAKDRQELWERTILTITRIPARHFTTLGKSITEFFGKGNPGVYKDLAGTVALNDLGTVLKIFLRFISPSMFIDRTPSMFRHYCSAGTVNLLDKKEKSLQYSLTEHKDYGIGLCWASEGWMTKGLEFVGAKQVKVVHSECIHNNKPNCIFNCTWE